MLDDWAKDAAPSPELRVAFSHKAERFEEFREHYIQELETGGASAGAQRLLALSSEHPDTVLLFAAKDQEHNHALVLLEFLENAAKSGSPDPVEVQ